MKLNSKKRKNTNNEYIKLKGLTAGMTYHLAGCCSPIVGDNIVGIVTAGIGVSVHTIDCEILSSYSDSPERWLDISWEKSSSENHQSISKINVTILNKPGSLGKVTTVIAKNNGNISNINFSTRKKDFFEIIKILKRLKVMSMLKFKTIGWKKILRRPKIFGSLVILTLC